MLSTHTQRQPRTHTHRRTHPHTHTNIHKHTHSYLADVGRGGEAELVAVDVEDHSGHLLDAIAVDDELEHKERREEQH